MSLEILRIEPHVVICRMDNGTIIDIDRKWLPAGIKVEESIEIDVSKKILELAHTVDK